MNNSYMKDRHVSVECNFQKQSSKFMFLFNTRVRHMLLTIVKSIVIYRLILNAATLEIYILQQSHSNIGFSSGKLASRVCYP